jgi:hypothetical protein
MNSDPDPAPAPDTTMKITNFMKSFHDWVDITYFTNLALKEVLSSEMDLGTLPSRVRRKGF